ncbi:MAG: cysteine--tRNA ligase [Roseicyclus sp.]|nr:cysteine--tRNA ligase [Roseicyclus sp.]
MVEIRLKNAKSHSVETLEPVIPGKVSMYLCGPTVYDRAHLGNARSAVVFDQLFRLLRQVYGADNVTFVRNFTDVDDRINTRAAAEGREIADLTAETAQWYLDDTTALGVLEPNHMPRATGYIAEMIAFIEDLITKGHAYAAEGHVLFSVTSFAEYGKLSGRSLDDMIAGARVEVAPYKRDPMDFVLWKPSADDIPGWESPWGRGRPGWHIECSAMAYALLGEEFDIHAGGADLLFPHHENEVAQSCAAGHAFARVWMHNEMLQVEGKKMSKSLGNFFTVRELLEQGYQGDVIRFVLLSTHYSKPMDWTAKKAEEAAKRLARWYRKTDRVEASATVPAAVEAALADDLNTHLALSEMEKLGARPLKAAMRLLGFPDAEDLDWFRATSISLRGMASAGAEPTGEDLLRNLLIRWQDLRNAKDYGAADTLKSAIEAAGVKLIASSDGPQAELSASFDPARLEGL